jgi:hypothetical protein
MLLRPIADPDFWWHIKTGEIILQQNNIPHEDIFSFSATGKPWIAHEWLSEVILYLTFLVGGITFTQMVFSLLIVFAFCLSIIQIENRTNLYAMGAALILGVIASTPVLWARPQVFSIVNFSLYIFLLHRFTRTESWIWLVPLPIIMILWVNQHGAFIIGLGIIGIFLLGLIIDNFVHLYKEKLSIRYLFNREVVCLIVLLFLSSLAALINPNGIRMLSYPFTTIADPSLQAFIQEWASPNFHERTWIPLALLFLALIGFGVKSKAKVSTTNILLLLIFGYLALLAQKQVAFFTIIAIPILSDLIDNLIPFTETHKKANIAVITVSILSVLAAIFMSVNTLMNLDKKQSEFMDSFYPSQAIDYFRQNEIKGNIFNSYNWGGYIIWNLYPGTKVYIDGRNDMYGAEHVKRYVDIYYALPGYEKALFEDNIKFILIEPDTYLAFALQESANWRNIYSDKVSVLFELISP